MELSKLLENINATADAPPKDPKEEDRLACLAACIRLQETLESPLEALLRIMFGAHQGAVLRLGVEMKLLEKAVAAKGPVTAEQLATDVSADPQLVGRITRFLAAMNLFEETGKDTYTAKPLAAAFIPPSPLAAGVVHLGTQIPVLGFLPDYLSENGYRNPSDAFSGPFQYAYRTQDHYFDWLAKRPALQDAFNTVMGVSRLARGDEWFDFYPVKEKLSVAAPSATLLVDIGGGLGHDLLAFRNKFPDLEGKLVVQDLPAVIAAATETLPPGIDAIGHDFFTPQPDALRNAKAFYLRTVLHDWPDAQAKVILGHIRSVMARDSILLINENAIPEERVPLYSAQGDLSMMAAFSSLDRTEAQFMRLLGEAGFEVVRVWRPGVGVPMSAVLFEAVVKR